VGETLADFPQNRGGPIPGHFDYKTDHDGCIRNFSYDIKPGWKDGDNILIAAHAVVIGPDGQEETGWGVQCGKVPVWQFPGANWATYMLFER
jgi:hypothetical protein